ncbi:DnaJ domain-containing protein [Candidatus Methylospira mobilis]|uniref:J domain-containing protein n=1 Tax=Candidatus Methylospira mobilis TaxID=1808979 RepID=UPI0028EFCBCA|nr:DnaJ domain-containing protein [Candidatus Methylospira mobilis]WNV04098.1 DnaJ domain-containing protein [Candidatus Methylospira mobilis]
MLQLLIAVIVLGLLFYGVAKLLGGNQNLSRSTVLWSIIAIAIVLLALTGRLGWLVPLIGAIAALLVRSAQTLAPLLPLLEKIWREHRRKPEAETTGATGGGNGMTRVEALAVLGLSEGATHEEIIAAHRRLMQKVHPDRGGSDYLASQLNKARNILLQ